MSGYVRCCCILLPIALGCSVDDRKLQERGGNEARGGESGSADRDRTQPQQDGGPSGAAADGGRPEPAAGSGGASGLRALAGRGGDGAAAGSSSPSGAATPACTNGVCSTLRLRGGIASGGSVGRDGTLRLFESGFESLSRSCVSDGDQVVCVTGGIEL